MSGIIFLGTKKLAEIHDFYINNVGCDLWMDQGGCQIFRHGNMLFGFCDRDHVDDQGVITFFYEKKNDVDIMYERFKSIALDSPKLNETYKIYHFYASDPEGRSIEFQQFDNPVYQYLSGDSLLLSRRSIRKFTDQKIDEDILQKVLNISCYAPTSMNTQSYYFKIIKDNELMRKLAGTRGKSSVPIYKAPMAVAICSDPNLSKRHVQDGCIGAYHFMLSSWFHGLGTCWIAAMDRDDVKDWLNIPQDHYVATVTPLGYPQHLNFNAPERKDISWFVKE
jgi:nitroreductase